MVREHDSEKARMPRFEQKVEEAKVILIFFISCNNLVFQKILTCINLVIGFTAINSFKYN